MNKYEIVKRIDSIRVWCSNCGAETFFHGDFEKEIRDYEQIYIDTKCRVCKNKIEVLIDFSDNEEQN